jgi:hypothetical protein
VHKGLDFREPVGIRIQKMKIRVIGHGGESRFPFGTSGPWKEFEKIILARGHEICKNGFSESADSLVANSYNPNIGEYLDENSIPKSRRILVLWEPYVVETTRYKKEVLSKFGTIFAPSIEWAEKVDGRSFNWPQDEILGAEVFIGWDTRINRAVMVQGNKFSARKGELYSLRRRVIVNLGPISLDLFGTNWNKGFNFDWWHWSRSVINSKFSELSTRSFFGIGKKYSNYFGVTNDKNKTLSKYKIAVVIENSADFISEKLFDSIRSGCVSVYVGPNLEKFGIPKGSAIQVDAKHEVVSSMVRSLLGKSDKELEKIARNQRDNLMKVSQEWNNTLVLSKLASDMVDILEAN